MCTDHRIVWGIRVKIRYKVWVKGIRQLLSVDLLEINMEIYYLYLEK